MMEGEGFERAHSEKMAEEKILYDLLVRCKWPEVATGLVSEQITPAVLF